MTSNIRFLEEKDIEKILNVEKKAFIPSIQTSEKDILRRLSLNHIYLGAEVDDKLIGTLAFRYASFIPNFCHFNKKNPTFFEYAESENEISANAIFIYSIGVIPEHRNFINAAKMLKAAEKKAKLEGLDYIVGDARIPSYNGSNNLPYEHFDKNEELHRAIDDYFYTGIMPINELSKDPVSGFYIHVFPNCILLGLTKKDFWLSDEPCGGHMVIGYVPLE